MRSTFVHRKHWIILKWITVSGNFPSNILSIRKTGWGRDPHRAGRDFLGLSFQALQTTCSPSALQSCLWPGAPTAPGPGLASLWGLSIGPSLTFLHSRSPQLCSQPVACACLLAFYMHFATCQQLWLKVQQRKHFKLLTSMRFDLLFAGSSYPCSVSGLPRDASTGFISFQNICDDKTSLWPNQFRD